MLNSKADYNIRPNWMLGTVSMPLVPERTSHPFVTYDMIREIPGTIRETWERNRVRTTEVARKVRNGQRLCFTGCGSALFAAMLGEQLLKAGHCGTMRSSTVEAFELANYDHSLDNSTTIIGVSHSGITKTTVDALRLARDKGAFTIGVTHYQDRPISKVADEIIIAGNSPDRSRCHTKCYVAGAVTCAQLGFRILEGREGTQSKPITNLERGFQGLPDLIDRSVDAMDNDSESLAAKYVSKKRYYFVGTGPNIPNALEAALKVKETSFVAAEGMEMEQMLHGPWVSLDEDCLLFIIAPRGPGYQRSVELAKAAKRLGVPTVGVVFDDDSEISGICEENLLIPSVDEYLSPFLIIIPLYFFAYFLSVKRGYNPDMIRYDSEPYWQARQIIFPPGTH